jgi:hypothetical protein
MVSKGSGIRIHGVPSDSGKELGKLHLGDSVTLLDGKSEKGWLRVRRGKSLEGWVSETWLMPFTPETKTKTAVTIINQWLSQDGHSALECQDAAAYLKEEQGSANSTQHELASLLEKLNIKCKATEIAAKGTTSETVAGEWFSEGTDDYILKLERKGAVLTGTIQDDGPNCSEDSPPLEALSGTINADGAIKLSSAKAVYSGKFVELPSGAGEIRGKAV